MGKQMLMRNSKKVMLALAAIVIVMSIACSTFILLQKNSEDKLPTMKVTVLDISSNNEMDGDRITGEDGSKVEKTKIAGKKDIKYYSAYKTGDTTNIKASNTVVLQLEGTDETKYKSNTLTKDKIVVKVGGNKVEPTTKELSDPELISDKGVRYNLTLSGIPGNGELSITIAENTLEDASTNQNIETTFASKVVLDNVAPTLNSINVTSPEAGSYKAGNEITIVSTYSENIYGDENRTAVKSETAPVLKLKFGNGEERTATFKETSGKTISYKYTIASGDNGALAVTGHSGTVYDHVGNSLTVGTKTIGGNTITADTTAPTLNSINVTSPAEGTYKAGQTVTIVATYSEAIYGTDKKAAATSSTAPTLKIKFGNSTERTATFDSTSGSTISYKYTIASGDNGALAVTGHSGTVYDHVGNSLTVGTKTIGGNAITADTTAPSTSTIKVTSPAAGAYKAGQTVTIQAAWNEAIYKDASKGAVVAETTTLKLKFGSGTERTATFSSISGSTVTYTYSIQSGDNGAISITEYSGTVYDAVGNSGTASKKDNSGNAITADTTKPTIEAAETAQFGTDVGITLKDNLSGVNGWQITTTNTEPTSNWTSITASTNTTVTAKNLTIGKKYIWIKDVAGNTQSKELTVYYKVTYSKGDHVTAIGSTGENNTTGKITLPSITPATGYHVDGWYNGSTKFGNVGEEKTISNNMSLTAKVVANTYTIKYNGNGATGGSTANSTHTYDTAKALTTNGYERKYKVTFNHNYTGSTNEEKTATYEFNGWAETAEGTKKYDDKESVTNLISTNNGTVNLYAKWTKKGVSYNPTRKGYTFAGWFETSECTGTRVDSNGSYTPIEAKTLYAKWTANVYTVNLNQNGGTGGTTVIYEKYATGWYSDSACNNAITSITKPTKTGYTFAGYVVEGNNEIWIDGTGKIVLGAKSTSVNNITLVAKWTIVTYSITYNLGGGSNGSGNPSSYTIESNAITINNASRTGYTFRGWTGSNDLSSGLGSYTTSSPYTAGVRDHILGNEFNITAETTYRVFVTAKRTKGNLDMQGGLWYTAQSSGNGYDGYSGAFTLAESLSDGWARYYKDVTVPTGKTKAKFYIQLNQTSDNYTTSWSIADISVINPGATVSIPKGSTGNKTYRANWSINQYTVTYKDVFVDSSNVAHGDPLGTTTKQKDYGTTVNATELGTDTTLSKYYQYYQYKGTSGNATVGTSGATVYRYFWAWQNINVNNPEGNEKTDGSVAKFSVSYNGAAYVANQSNETQASIILPHGGTIRRYSNATNILLIR